MTPANDNVSRFSRDENQNAARSAVFAFYKAFRRAPNTREMELLVGALTRYFTEPDAPSTRLQ
jgi:hypothetical protein